MVKKVLKIVLQNPLCFDSSTTHQLAAYAVLTISVILVTVLLYSEIQYLYSEIKYFSIISWTQSAKES